MHEPAELTAEQLAAREADQAEFDAICATRPDGDRHRQLDRQLNPHRDPRGSSAWQRALTLGRGTCQHARPRTARPRGAGRPRARAVARASSRGGDSGDDSSGLSEPPGERAGHHLHLVPDLPARQVRYTFACLTAEERGAQVEPVVEP